MSQNLGVKLIPDKNKVYRLSAEDTLVVLAEDETTKILIWASKALIAAVNTEKLYIL